MFRRLLRLVFREKTQPDPIAQAIEANIAWMSEYRRKRIRIVDSEKEFS